MSKWCDWELKLKMPKENQTLWSGSWRNKKIFWAKNKSNSNWSATKGTIIAGRLRRQKSWKSSRKKLTRWTKASWSPIWNCTRLKLSIWSKEWKNWKRKISDLSNKRKGSKDKAEKVARNSTLLIFYRAAAQQQQATKHQTTNGRITETFPTKSFPTFLAWRANSQVCLPFTSKSSLTMRWLSMNPF